MNRSSDEVGNRRSSDRLYRTLLLALEPDTALAIETRSGRRRNQQARLQVAFHQAIRAHQLARVRALLPGGRHAATSSPPLGVSSRVGSLGAVLLAFHLGLDLSVAELAELGGQDRDEIGLELVRARQTAGLEVPNACRDRLTLLGRYRDRSLDTQQRMELFHHERTCPDCAAVLEAARGLDARLLTALDGEFVRADLGPTKLGAHWRPGIEGLPIFAMLGILSLVALFAIVVGIDRIQAERRPIVALAAPEADAPAAGWLLRTTINGRLEALDLRTGHRRVIIPGSWWGGHLLSPSRTLIATWRTNDEGASARGVIEIAGLDGVTRQSWDWVFPATARFPRAWIGDDTLLFSEAPIYRGDGTTEAYLARLNHNSRLVALDIETGRTWTVFDGWVARAEPSPDGNFIALIREQDPDWGGRTIEIRPLSRSGIGDVLAQLEHRYADTKVGPLWSPDGSRIFFPMIDEAGPLTLEQQYMVGTGPPVNRIALASLALSGELRKLSDRDDGVLNSPIGLSPDGGRLIFVRHNPLARPLEWSLWETSPDGSEMQQLLVRPGQQDWLDSGVVWSPDGVTMLLADTRPLFVPAESEERYIAEGTATVLLGFQPDADQPAMIRRETGLWGSELIAWLPASALPPVGELDAMAPGSGGTRAWDGGLTFHLGPDAAISPDGRYVLMRHGSETAASPSIHELQTTVDLESEIRHGSDFSWLSSSAAVIGVSETAGPDMNGSRIALFTAEPDRPTPDFLDRYFDPAGIGPASDKSYATPRVSPRQSRAVFFVRDAQAGTVQLWAADWNIPAYPVATWSLPDNRLLDPPVIATWFGEDQLLFARPDDWQDGLPRAIRVERLTFGIGRNETIETLLVWDTRGNERGLVLQEFQPSPSGNAVAYRLRHFGETSIERGVYDSLHHVTIYDLGSPVEIIRGDAGAGLAWSWNGDQIAAGLGGRIAVMSPDGRRLRYLGFEGPPASQPVWVAPDEIWFTIDDGDGLRIAHGRLD